MSERPPEVQESGTPWEWQNPVKGEVGGWSVHLRLDGRWQWSAFSRGGATYGHAFTKDDAERRAQAECERLKLLGREVWQ